MVEQLSKPQHGWGVEDQAAAREIELLAHMT